MVITEIFKSIQGEGTRSGLPCVFVRLTGCNLRCKWCDTEYAFHGGAKLSPDAILEKVAELAGGKPLMETATRNGPAAIPLVELTGGEPLLQKETPHLAEMLLEEGYTVMIETSGERYVGMLPRDVIKIVDVKCPDSGAADTFDMANLEVIGRNDEIKFVIATRRDYDFALDFTMRHRLAERVHEVFLSPVFADPAGRWPALSPRSLVGWMLEDGIPARLGMQIHKFIWDPATKGV